MKYTLSVLNGFAGIVFIMALWWLIFNDNEGFDFLVPILFFAMSLVAIIADFFIKLIIKNKRTLNIVEAILLFIFLAWSGLIELFI